MGDVLSDSKTDDKTKQFKDLVGYSVFDATGKLILSTLEILDGFAVLREHPSATLYRNSDQTLLAYHSYVPKKPRSNPRHSQRG